MARVGSNCRHKDDVFFLSLEGVHCVDHDVGLKVLQLLRIASELIVALGHDGLPLRLVGSDDAHGGVGL